MPQKYIKCSKRFADVWGLDVAVVMEQVKYWLTRNSDKTDCIHEDAVWFYCSVRELTDKYFPYWTSRQLASLLEYMVEVGLLRVGRYNKRRYDRTKWYTVVDSRILEEEDFVPERKTKTKRRAISRTPVCNRILANVEGSDTDGKRSDLPVGGSDADVRTISPSCGTYTTTKQQLTTNKETEKEHINSFTRSRVEGGKEPPSNHSNPLFETEERIKDSIPLPHTEGVKPPSVLGEETLPPLRSEVDSPRKESPFDDMCPTVRSARSNHSPKDIERAFEEMFRRKPNKIQSNNTVTQTERVRL
jgi:hypothetical protein